MSTTRNFLGLKAESKYGVKLGEHNQFYDINLCKIPLDKVNFKEFIINKQLKGESHD